MKIRFLILCSLLVVSLSACSSERYSAATTTFPRLALTTPPAPVYEISPQLEDPQMEIWRPGYWDYNGVSFDWIPGRVMQRPAPYAVWSADRWEKRAYGWCFVPGFWI